MDSDNSAVRTYYGYHTNNIHPVTEGEAIAPGTIVFFGSYADKTEGIVVKEGRTGGEHDEYYITVLWSVWDKDGVFDFTTIKFPRVKFPSFTCSSDLVGIQPMTLPTGLIFNLDYKYGSGSK